MKTALLFLALLYFGDINAEVVDYKKIPQKNTIDETIIAFGTVTGSFVQFIDLGGKLNYNRIEIVSTLDEDVLIQAGIFEFTVIADEASTKDGFVHGGILSIKHKGAAPTTGRIVIKSF